MFDLSRLGDTVSGLIGNSHSLAGAVPADLMGALEAAGLDPNVLQGLSEAQAFELLADFGIDASQFDLGGLLGDAAQNFVGDGVVGQGVLGALQEALGQRDL